MARPPSAVLRYLKLPDNLEKGRYDEYGHPVADDQPASLVLYALPGAPPDNTFAPLQVWGVFDRPLEPSQYGYLIFTNVPGQGVPGGAFTEWDPMQSSPTFTDQLLTVYSVQRAPGSARIIGCNESREPVHAAAGLLFVAPPQPPGATPAEAPPAEPKPTRRSR
jgi:hypothetical protein